MNVGEVYEDGGFFCTVFTNRQTGTDRQAGRGGGRQVVGGREMDRQCALSCLDENKQLSDPLRT